MVQLLSNQEIKNKYFDVTSVRTEQHIPFEQNACTDKPAKMFGALGSMKFCSRTRRYSHAEFGSARSARLVRSEQNALVSTHL